MTKASDFGLETPKFNLDSYVITDMWQQQKIGKVAAADHANPVVSIFQTNMSKTIAVSPHGTLSPTQCDSLWEGHPVRPRERD